MIEEPLPSLRLPLTGVVFLFGGLPCIFTFCTYRKTVSGYGNFPGMLSLAEEFKNNHLLKL